MQQVAVYVKKTLMKLQKIPLKYFAYGFGAVSPMIFKTQADFLRNIEKWKFITNPLSKK